MGTVADTEQGGTRAYEFDGIDQHINVPNHVSYAIPGDTFTVGTWARVDKVAGGNQFLMAHSNALGDGWAFYVANADSTRSLNLAVFTSSLVIKAQGSAFTIGQWALFVATYDGAEIQLYVDGAPYGGPMAQTGNVAQSSQPMTLGILGSQAFGGRTDDMRLFSNTVLTPQQILDWYNGGRGYEPGVGFRPWFAVQTTSIAQLSRI